MKAMKWTLLIVGTLYCFLFFWSIFVFKGYWKLLSLVPLAAAPLFFWMYNGLRKQIKEDKEALELSDAVDDYLKKNT